ncbi:MAG: sensor histidine kinase [bacterium]
MRTALVLEAALLLILSAPYSTSAQSSLRFERLSLEQGAAFDLAYCILQDRTGFMWFGTMYGLVKYDGRRHTVYKHDPADTNSISFNDIIALYEDRIGHLWLGTWGGGLNRFDPATEKFTRFVHDPVDTNSVRDNIVWAICEDRAGNMWVGTQSGLDKLDFEAEIVSSATPAAKFLHYRLPPENTRRAGAYAIRALLVDDDNRIWIGTAAGGLFCLTVKNGREHLQHYRNDEMDPASLSAHEITALHRDQKANLWIGTANGLNKLIALPGTDAVVVFQRFKHAANNPFSLSHNHISALAEDARNDGTLWIGTVRGLNRFDHETQTFARFKHEPVGPYSSRSNSVAALCVDRSRVLWVADYYGGVHKADLRGAAFSHDRHGPGNEAGLSAGAVRAFYQDRSGTTWIGTFGGGLNVVSASDQDDSHVGARSGFVSSRQYAHYRADDQSPRGLRSNLITALAGEASGHIWVGTHGGGLTQIDAERRMATYQHHPADNTSLSSNNVLCLLLDRAGDLWIGTDNGLNQFNRARQHFARYSHAPDQPQSLSDHVVHTIFEDRQGDLWLGTYRGLNRFDRQTLTFHHYRHRLRDPHSLSNDYVYAIHEDRAGDLWVGTSDGLNRFDRATGSFRSYKEKEGLPNGVICGIQEDDRGRLWMSTYKGLCCFDPQSGVCKNYDTVDGLQSNMFCPGASYRNQEGVMYFGGANGYNYFQPQAIHPYDFVPPVVLTAVKVFAKTIAPVPRASAPLILPHDQNFFTFEFAALSFAQPENNLYAYRLEGVDHDWIHAGTRNLASYAGVQPGRYLFRFKGASHDGAWNEKETTLALVITPPFWRTWWFYTLEAGALALMLLAWHRKRLARERARVVEIERIKSTERIRSIQEVEQARREERERVRKKIAADFHDESGHKLTKISLLCGVLQSNLRAGALEIDGYLERIMKAAASLHRDISDFIWSLDPAQNTLHDAALILKEFGDKLFEHTGMRFDMPGLSPELEHALLPMEIRQNFTCIFKEGMNNVLKHNRTACKYVTFMIARDNGHFTARLTDDGQGFDPENCVCGHGLRNMRERAAAVGGKLEILSTPGKGTTIQFTGFLDAGAK